MTRVTFTEPDQIKSHVLSRCQFPQIPNMSHIFFLGFLLKFGNEKPSSLALSSSSSIKSNSSKLNLCEYFYLYPILFVWLWWLVSVFYLFICRCVNWSVWFSGKGRKMQWIYNFLAFYEKIGFGFVLFCFLCSYFSSSIWSTVEILQIYFLYFSLWNYCASFVGILFVSKSWIYLFIFLALKE